MEEDCHKWHCNVMKITYSALLYGIQTITRALNIVKIHVVATKMRIQKRNDLSSLLEEENDLEVERMWLAVSCSTLVDLQRRTHGLQLMPGVLVVPPGQRSTMSTLMSSVDFGSIKEYNEASLPRAVCLIICK